MSPALFLTLTIYLMACTNQLKPLEVDDALIGQYALATLHIFEPSDCGVPPLTEPTQESVLNISAKKTRLGDYLLLDMQNIGLDEDDPIMAKMLFEQSEESSLESLLYRAEQRGAIEYKERCDLIHVEGEWLMRYA